jgi:hypothetical protein
MTKRRPVTFQTPEPGDIIYVDEVFSYPKSYHPDDYLLLSIKDDFPVQGGIAKILSLQSGITKEIYVDSLRYFSIQG